MHHKYAQIKLETGVCVSVSYLFGPVDDPDMIPLTPEDDVQPGDIWDGEAWTRPEPLPYEPVPSPIEQLEEENALLALELAQTQLRLEQAEQEQAALLLELVTREVI